MYNRVKEWFYKYCCYLLQIDVSHAGYSFQIEGSPFKVRSTISDCLVINSTQLHIQSQFLYYQ